MAKSIDFKMQNAQKSVDIGEDEDDDEDDESDSEDSEDIEPKLKYERLANDLTSILSKDAASCISVNPKFLVLGTHWGNIYILDHIGNRISDKGITAHTTTVNQISIDANGDFMASCSDDGKVVITGLYSSDSNQVVELNRPVKAIALDPQYYKPNSGRQYVTGDDKLLLNEKSGFLGRHKTTVLHQGEGPIRNIKWGGEFIAWANNHGVKVYDTTSKSKITKIDKDHDLRPELCICQLVWRDSRTLLIGWADRIKICVVKDQVKTDMRDNAPTRFCEITSMFTTDFIVCGIAPLATNLVVLSYDKTGEKIEEGRMSAGRPHLQILEPHLKHFEEISNDALSIRGFQEYRSIEYHLECLPDENLYFIVSPKDVVVAKLRDQDDHITWLMEHGRYEEAMAVALEHTKELKTHSYHAIGRAYLDYLLEEQAYDEAGRLCVKILGKKRESWTEEIYKFAKIKQLKAIATYIPRSDPRLDSAIYEMVLNEFLSSDYERFYQLVKEWPPDLYDSESIINVILARLDREKNHELLLQSLGQLYAHQKAFDKALGIYLRLKHKDVFTLIHDHKLYDKISDKIIQLMDLDKDRAVKMLLDHNDTIPVEKVVQQLSKSQRYLYLYLDQLVQKDLQGTQEYHGQLVKLYAEFERPKLLPFLRRSEFYPLQTAWEECEARDYVNEQVFLLGRMGNLTQALKLITEKLQDVNHAIQFCMEQADEELWENLIEYAMGNPKFITALLHNVGAHIDPIKVISKIRKDMEIPGLRDSLVKILQDYNLQLSLRDGCRKILVADSFNLLERLVKTQRRGVFVDGSQLCPVCNQRLTVNDLRFASNLNVFHCRHAFHEDCLPAYVTNCIICNSIKKDRRPGAREHFMK
ncbi:vacuolar protein sorting-associated protein 41 homolog isoform X2 [Physella acuta]|uniref:vacuolar protein sorting-associated protein 41 homolog isoform X2 n=1 Tax=Physella acuta TaxID=109671 RepID=UPI0027DD3796|nr:vacuolar protein sorting-associated protein 41 homolog isoform X2 [Physella acuta]